MSGETHPTLAMLPAVEVAERSDPGRDPTKQINEDAFGHRETPFGVLAVVCDGMGGHVGGREASSAALATIFEAFESAPPATPARDVLRDAIRLANVRVRGLAVSDAGGGRPGSTVVAVLVHATGTEVAHVGDSRVYLVQQGQIFQVTRDHSMVQEMVEAKILTPDQAAIHPDANKITRALGIDDDVDVDLRPQPIAHVAGDSFVLCSDGLSDLVEAPEILAIVSSDPPGQAVGKLVDLANARGGHDNVTVVILRPRTSAPPAAPGAVALTIADSQLVTLRPPREPPLRAVIPAAPPPPPPVAPRRRLPVSVVVGLALAVVGVGVAAALLFLDLDERGGKSTSVPRDAAPHVVHLATSSSAVQLEPVAMPDAAVTDASDVSPLDPVSAPPTRGKPRGLSR